MRSRYSISAAMRWALMLAAILVLTPIAAVLGTPWGWTRASGLVITVDDEAYPQALVYKSHGRLLIKLTQYTSSGDAYEEIYVYQPATAAVYLCSRSRFLALGRVLLCRDREPIGVVLRQGAKIDYDPDVVANSHELLFTATCGRRVRVDL